MNVVFGMEAWDQQRGPFRLPMPHEKAVAHIDAEANTILFSMTEEHDEATIYDSRNGPESEERSWPQAARGPGQG